MCLFLVSSRDRVGITRSLSLLMVRPCGKTQSIVVGFFMWILASRALKSSINLNLGRMYELPCLTRIYHSLLAIFPVSVPYQHTHSLPLDLPPTATEVQAYAWRVSTGLDPGLL